MASTTTSAPTTVLRSDYRPPAFVAERIELEFDLDPDLTRVTATTRYLRNPGADGPFALDGDGLRLVEVAMDGRVLAPGEYAADPARLSIAEVPDAFTLRVVTELQPSTNTALSGLYVSQGSFFTQCEAQGFRRITYFPDRPDVMARYRVTLRADQARFPVLLSNGNLVGTGPCLPGADGHPRHQAVWDDPFPKPSYLFALVAGNLVVREQVLRTASGRDALLQIWVEPGNEDKTHYAMRALVNAIRWDEQRFGLELDLDRFMIVAVGDFNMGAMENKGLNIFNTKYVFATPRIATDADFVNVESVVGHEYFHNWTGNRVTCRDWFQLTLKEGLTVFRDQEFSADMFAADAPSPAVAASARAVKRIEDVRTLRAMQFPEDAGPMAHPIRPDAYQEINNFYTVTVYEKGAEVIRMLQTLVGRDGFRRGMDLYFRRHDGQAVTCDDFVAAIADANARELSQFRRWYAQAGTPRVSVRGHHDPASRTYTLEMVQANPQPAGRDDLGPLHIPVAVGLLAPDGTPLPLHTIAVRDTDARDAHEGRTTRVLELVAGHQRFTFHDVDVAPVPSLLRDFSAPVVVDYPYTTQELGFLVVHDTDPFNRWEAAQRLAVAAIVAAIEGTDLQRACAPVVDAFAKAIADASLDPAFVDLLLTLPSEGVVAEQLPVVDPAAIRAARDGLMACMASTLGAARWRELWSRNVVQGPYSPDPVSTGRRALMNTALLYWTLTGEPDAWGTAAAQFANADNMTVRQGALHALCLSLAPQRDDALAAFAREFADEPLVMDKWFAIQATLHRRPDDPPVLERVRALATHPAFSIRNPNKVRALVASFCSGNLAEFHAPDGSGYRFWVEQITAIDALNPQVAARLARALDRWRKFTPDRQVKMRMALEEVALLPDLSKDVREIVGKALAS